MKFKYKELFSVSAQQFRIGGFHQGSRRYLLIFHAASVDSLRLSESAQPLQPQGLDWLELSCVIFIFYLKKFQSPCSLGFQTVLHAVL